MSDFDKALEDMAAQAPEKKEEVKLPSLEEQKEVVAKLKQLEAEGKLTPEVLESFFGQFADDADVPVH
ncbi:hypothetical protein VA7868_03759 [Vibrio aerogenes CECT 7868]|uniref:Chromosome partitioning protein ParA n=1 Tax=Vibrio aerogenes CECT 7868 TaxID=1216006 RepID=A0A1M6BCQ9_9VIBR|nr:restriction endonuclease subunit S [Vibrio aerogenes]SHI46467.1 hypothetical protein VA7868_03759 [Vibrio aerogenes CECT 7868]